MAAVEYDDAEERRRLSEQPGNRGTTAPTATTPGTPVGEPIRDAVPSAPTVPGSRFNADQWAGFRTQAQEAGAPEGWFDDFIRRNPDDPNRAAEAFSIPTDHRPYDSQSSNPLQQQANFTADQLSPFRNAIAASQRGTGSSFYGGASGGGAPQVGGFPQASRNSFTFDAPPNQFDDPYTKRLEDIINQQLAALQQPQTNPAMDQFQQFLNNQFTTLSNSPGYSPDDLALIRTQMLEPIERDRQANRDRVTQRTASRGMLPSSGIHEQDLQEFVDRPAMESRTAAQRDLSINAIDQRRKDLAQAMNVGRVGAIEIPGLMRGEDQSRRSEALSLASLAYELPGRALQENLSVINGTPGPESLFNQAIQLQNAQNEQRALNQQKWSQIGQLLAGLF